MNPRIARLALMGVLALADNAEANALKAAEEAGFDSGKNGPNETNCHPRHFATRERTEAWERGRDRAKTPHSREGDTKP